MAEHTRLVYEDFRPLRPGESGYVASKRLLISPSTGEIISRRKFITYAEKQKYHIQPKKAIKPKPVIPAKKTVIISLTGKKTEIIRKKKDRYNMRVNQYVENINSELISAGFEPDFTRNEAIHSPVFQQIYKDLASKDKSPGGKKAQALIALGLRDARANYDVGDTP